MRIFFIRHGESLKNAEKCDLIDWKVPLTNKGNNQALQIGKSILNYCKSHNISLDNSVVMSSPYIRAKQTAININKSLNLPLITNYSITEYQHDEHLTPTTQIEQDTNNLLNKYPLFQKLINDKVSSNPNENNVEIVLRAKSVIKNLKQLPYENIFIVSHKGFIKAFITAFNNKDYSSYFEHHVVENCSVKLFEIHNNIFKDEGNILNP